MTQPPPTIILDEPCARLREAVAAFAPVFVFKATRGFLSPPLPAAEELSAGLAVAGLRPPYVLVAASFGGFAALAYADRHRETLAGLVLVDASHPDQGPTALAAIPAGTPVTPKVAAFRKHLEGFGPVWTEGCATMAAIRNIGDIPLIVLAAGNPDMPDELPRDTRLALTQGWHALQRKHAARSTRGELRIVPGAGHDLIRLAPDTVVAAIRELALRPVPVRHARLA
jgi:pimeloyl-ACP methyl ester carboxylesterase